MRNPLLKRLPRQLKEEVFKYFVIGALLISTIGLVSGFLVADNSMIKAYNESFEKYHIEDGHFIISSPLTQRQKINIEKHHVHLYEQNFYEEEFSNKAKIRIYQTRNEVNKACLMKGTFPKNKNEIAIDRLYAENNKIKLGDSLSHYKVVGLVALSDYSALFENNSDSMFDSIKFGVGIVSKETFISNQKKLNYEYAWTYHKKPSNEKEVSESLMSSINKIVTLKEYVPRYLNQAINFTGEDFGRDKASIEILLGILLVIIAFVFAVTISHTIDREAMVIGTLMASGYTKKELIIHYLTLPVVITLISALIGNILGYSLFKDLMAGLYYQSYSLPSYQTIWNVEAFLFTTILPICLMMIINLFILSYKLSLSPLKFIRNDLKRKHKKRTLRLSDKIPFFDRFRLRIIFNNISNYTVMFVGILFANILLLFALGMSSMIDNYQQEIKDNMISKYQYILKLPYSVTNNDDMISSYIHLNIFQYETSTHNKDAEKFMIYSLKTTGSDGSKIEDINVYGVKENSRFISIGKNDIAISRSYAEKYNLKKGDSIILNEPYNTKSYRFTVTRIYNYTGAVCVFMNQKALNEKLGLDNSFYNAYFSNSAIKDIKDEYIGTVIDLDTLTKISVQLEHSLGSLVNIYSIMVVILYVILIYLLSKLIIEKSSHAISIIKVLGYDDLEISGLYIIATSLMVLLFLVLTIPLAYVGIKPFIIAAFKRTMSGWITFYVSNSVFIRMFIYGSATYLIVLIYEFIKIKRIEMAQALKIIE